MKASILSRLIVTALCAPAAEFHVSPSGDDGCAGTKDKPFATLARAQQAARVGRPRTGMSGCSSWSAQDGR